jgi:hypothetical protein
MMVLSKAAYTLVLRKVEEEVNLSKLKMLRKVPGLNQLTGRSLERIVRCMQTQYPKPGELVFAQGGTATHAFLLRTGKCVSKQQGTGGADGEVEVEHEPGEMLGLRELVFKAPYTATMRCVGPPFSCLSGCSRPPLPLLSSTTEISPTALSGTGGAHRCMEPHTELLVIAGEDLNRHSKGILHGLHAYEPPEGATVHPPFSVAALAAASSPAQIRTSRDDTSPTQAAGGGWALTALPRDRSPSPPRTGLNPLVYPSPPGTPLHILTGRTDTPQSWLGSEFSALSVGTSARTDTPEVGIDSLAGLVGELVERRRPPTAYSLREATREAREAKEAARAVAITSTREEPFTWRSHLEMLQSKLNSAPSFPSKQRAARVSGKEAYPTLPFPHALRPTTAPIPVDGQWLDPRAPGSPTYRPRPNTAEAFANDGRAGAGGMAGGATGLMEFMGSMEELEAEAEQAEQVSPAPLRPVPLLHTALGMAALRSGRSPTASPSHRVSLTVSALQDEHDDVVAALERREKARKKRLERTKADSPRDNQYNAAGETQHKFFQELQKTPTARGESKSRRARRVAAMGGTSAAAAAYARSKLGIEPSVDPELGFMTQVRRRWVAAGFTAAPVESSRASPPHSPREDGLAHPAET